MTEHAVVIAGGGPTELMLAGELALAGVEVAIVERRASQDLIGSRAGGLHSRTIEFPGWDPTMSCLIAEVEIEQEPQWGLRRDDKGIHSLSRTGDGGPVRRCDILSRTHKEGSGWAATCWVSRRSTRRRSRSLAARARTWGGFRGSKASACRLAFA
jgi:hypothetical protein